ncbi:MAG: DUF962 domain-containing protein [Rhodospirillaceae bacterium]|nr:DUF962 domain-containing protein [Rhodospirillaceae bacterium]
MREWFMEQLAMYAAYHRDRRNQATHHVGVPLIVYSLLVAASQVHLGTVPFGESPLPLSLGAFLLFVLFAFYLSNLFVVGVIAMVIYGALYGVAETVGRGDPQSVWTTFALCFVGGWIIQFVGHIFEGRKPALFTNLTQIFMAPVFLIAEILFALGLEKDLERDVMARSVKYNVAPKAA